MAIPWPKYLFLVPLGGGRSYILPSKQHVKGLGIFHIFSRQYFLGAPPQKEVVGGGELWDWKFFLGYFLANITCFVNFLAFSTPLEGWEEGFGRCLCQKSPIFVPFSGDFSGVGEPPPRGRRVGKGQMSLRNLV